MKKTTHNSIYILSAFFLFSTVWMLLPDQLDMGIIQQNQGQLEFVPDYKMKSFRYVSSRGLKREMEIYATQAVFNVEKQLMDGENILAYFYNEIGEKTRLTGKFGNYAVNDRVMHLKKDVESLSAEGFKMNSDRSVFYVDKSLLVVPTPVNGVSSTDDLKIFGNRAESDLNTDLVHFYEDVQTEFTEKRGPTTIKSDVANMDRLQKVVSYEGNVLILQEDLETTSRRAKLFYEQQKASSSEEKSKTSLKYMACYDDVLIKQNNNRYARSQVAEFYAQTDTVVLTVYPSVHDVDDIMTGDKITMFRSTGVVEVNSVNASFKEGFLKKKPDSEELTDEEILKDEEESELVL